jgi:hypothetical protein
MPAEKSTLAGDSSKFRRPELFHLTQSSRLVLPPTRKMLFSVPAFHLDRYTIKFENAYLLEGFAGHQKYPRVAPR